ncbi:MAG: fumarylacetoacetate hydrolase family protein [Oscillospiraceae bacterium]|nr:fumarylacetoacetate hydrolase family protein [Oscillospiraceae bacterium]
MKLYSMTVDGRPCVGAESSTGIVDLSAAGLPATMNEIIDGGSGILAQIKEIAEGDAYQKLDPGSIKYLPVTKPKKIICEGLNYKDHAEETGGDIPAHPIFFSKFDDALVGHDTTVPLPQWLSRYDYEAELVIVIGKSAYNVSVEEAEMCIFGYTCGNDLSARDAQFLSSQWLAGKALPGSGPTGPCIVTRDSFDPREPHGIYCEVNGSTVQSGNTTEMIFPCFEAVSAASKFFPLSPSDLIFTGTPAGVIQGRKREERIWLKPGDIVNVTIDGIGTLTTTLAALPL